LIPVAYDQVGHGRVSVDIGAAYAFAAAMTYLVLSRTLLSGNGAEELQVRGDVPLRNASGRCP